MRHALTFALTLLVLSGCTEPETKETDTPPRSVSVSEDVTLNYRKVENPIVLFARLDQEIKRWQEAVNNQEHHRVVYQERALEELSRGNFSTLVTSLKKEKEAFRRISAMALGFTHEERAVGPLVEALRDSSPQVRANALLALGNLRQQGAPVKPIAELLASDKHASVRSHAAYALYWILEPGNDRGCMMTLIKATADPDAAVRAHAVLALATVKSSFAVPTLTGRSLFDESVNVRYNAALALGEIGDKAAVAPLIEALKDRETQVRKACAVSLHKLTGKNYGQNAAAWRTWAKANLDDLQRPPAPKTGGKDGPEGKQGDSKDGEK